MVEHKKVNFISWFIVGLFAFFGLFVAGIFIWLFIIMPSPPNRTNFKLYSMDKSQCVSVITNGDTRYFINGEHKSVPKSDFVKIDISKVSRIGDEIGVCWKKGAYEWEVVNHRSKIIENKLDTLKHKFYTRWEEDERGTPNSKKYHEPNCGTIGTETMKVYEGNEIILVN